MKKILFTLTLLISLSFVLPTFALSLSSDTILGDTRSAAGFPDATDTSISVIVGVYIKGALSIIGTIFLVLTIYAGILWMTASGNDEQVKKAISILTAAMIGMIIVTSAYSITAFIVGLGVSTTPTDPSGAPCYLGNWEKDENDSPINKAAYDATCGLKGVVRGLGGLAGGVLDMFSGGAGNLADKWSRDYNNPNN